MSVADRRLVTGAPGTGKTAVLARLAASYAIVPEPARLVLADVRARGDEPRDLSWSAFVDLLLSRSIAQYESVPAVGPILFDRGVPDCAAYAIYFGIDPSAYLQVAQHHRYETAALLFEPWEDIYTTDDERTMTFAMTVSFHEAVLDAYDLAGYELHIVPQVSLEARAQFVADFLAA